jgi:hypothetical protein
MTKLGRSTTIGCLFFGVLVLAAPSSAQTRPPIAEQIAKIYGLGSFGKIEAIRYTFNIGLPGGEVKISRSWIWRPKTDEVSYEAKDKDGKPVKVTYFRSQLEGEPADVKEKIDPAFVNDEYNLLFPLHVYWDSSADVQDLGMQKLPLGKGSGKRVVVKYPSEGGYTPGDTWELYLGRKDRVKEFVYLRGGPTPPKLVILTWAGYKKAGPLLFSTDRRGTADGKPARVFFSDVSVKLVGSDTWVNAK